MASRQKERSMQGMARELYRLSDGVQREKPGMPEVSTGKGLRSKISKNLEGQAKEAELDLVSSIKGEC